MNITLPATKVRQSFFTLIEKAERPGASVTITLGGEPKVVMMSLEDFEGWQETLEIMSDKCLMRGVRKSLRDVAKKKFYSEKDVKKKLHL